MECIHNKLRVHNIDIELRSLVFVSINVKIHINNNKQHVQHNNIEHIQTTQCSTIMGRRGKNILNCVRWLTYVIDQLFKITKKKITQKIKTKHNFEAKINLKKVKKNI